MIQQKQRKVLKSWLFVRVCVRALYTRKVPKLNNSEDVKYLSLCQNRPRTSQKNKERLANNCFNRFGSFTKCYASQWFVAPIYNGSLRKSLFYNNV